MLAEELRKLSDKYENKVDLDTKDMIKKLVKLCKKKAKQGGNSIVWFTNLPFNVEKVKDYFKKEGCEITINSGSSYCMHALEGKFYKHRIDIEW